VSDGPAPSPPAPNPIVARITRAGRDESIHRGFGAVVDVSGAVVASFGTDAPIYWRSAAKPFQAMPFLEARGDAAFSLAPEEVALACASHDGEPAHAATARSMLEKGGFTAEELRCGAHPPYDDAAAAALVRAGKPFSTLHNNCSGKHAAMLLACRLFGFDPATYDRPDHPLQREIRRRIAFYGGVPEPSIEIGVDGCSLPVFRLPIAALATAYARLLAPGVLSGETEDAADARRRIAAAMTGCPFFVSGTGQFTTLLLEAGRGRWIGKEGAEGVYAIAVAPGTGIAFKTDDGGARARNAIAIDLLRKIGALDDPPESLRGFVRPTVRNVRGTAVGDIVADVPLERRAVRRPARAEARAGSPAAPR